MRGNDVDIGLEKVKETLRADLCGDAQIHHYNCEVNARHDAFTRIK